MDTPPYLAATVALTIFYLLHGTSGVEYVVRGTDQVLYTSVLGGLSNSSRVECGHACLTTPGCHGFDWMDSEAECVLHDGRGITEVTPLELTADQDAVITYAWRHLVCGGSSCYVMTSQTMDPPAGREYCREYGMDLVAIETRAEFDYLYLALQHMGMNPEQYYWTSGSDAASEGAWVWQSTGASVSPTDLWAAGQPDNAGSGEDCLEAFFGSHFNDGPCHPDRRNPIICEYNF